MSIRAKGPRLWLEPATYNKDGTLRRRASWIIRDDGGYKKRTGFALEERQGAERALSDYIDSKHEVSRERGRHPSQILVSDVLAIYTDDVVRHHARPKESGQRIVTLSAFWEPYTLADVNGARCREYVALRTSQFRKSCKPDQTKRPALRVTAATARRELEELRAAINHHRREGLCAEVVEVALPEKGRGRDVHLTRSEAAGLVRSAWRAKQVMIDGITDRATGKHVARFILVGLYTGTRHAAICGAAFQPAIGRGFVDLERGVFHRRARGARETKKRQPPVRIPDRLLAHLRRWRRLGISTHAVVEWNGRPVRSVRKGFKAAAVAAGLPITGADKITPHVLRHTAATWMMQNGVDLWQAAGFLGMTVEMLQDRYGHHHPDFQADAARAISSSPGRAGGQHGDKLTVNKARQTAMNAHEKR